MRLFLPFRVSFGLLRGPLAGGTPVFALWLLSSCVPGSRARAPQAEKERGEGKATGTPESQRGQRGQRGQKCNRRAFPICRGLVPGKGRTPGEKQRLGAGRLVVFSLGGFWACVSRGPARACPPSREGKKGREGNGDARSQRAREAREAKEAKEAREAKSATDGLFLYVGASFPARGGPPERSRDWEPDAWLSLVWVAFGLVGPVPARGPQAKKERGKGKATGTPGAKEPARPERPERPKVQQTGFSYM